MTLLLHRIAPGVPPRGLGLFVYQRRSVSEPVTWWQPGADWDFFIAIPGALAAACRASGQPTWLFRTPEDWTPDTWRATLADLVARVRRGEGVGVVANPESGWQSASGAEAEEFGRALAAAGVPLGVVTYPALVSSGVLARTAAVAGDAAWWSIELYGRSVTPQQAEAHRARWARIIPAARTIPTVPGFVPDTDLGRSQIGTRPAYRAFLRALWSDENTSAMVWPSGPAWMVPELLARFRRQSIPADPSSGTAALTFGPLAGVGVELAQLAAQLEGFATTDAGIATSVGLVLFLVLVIAGATLARRRRLA